MNSYLILLAQTEGGAPGGGQGAPTSSPLAFFFPAMLMAMVVYMLLSARSQKKREKREREQMFANMSRNDRVQTVGGVIGTILSVKDDEVVLKVDESTNTKMTFVKTSIQRVLTSDALAGSGSK